MTFLVEANEKLSEMISYHAHTEMGEKRVAQFCAPALLCNVEQVAFLSFCLPLSTASQNCWWQHTVIKRDVL